MFRRDFFTGIFGVSLTSIFGVKKPETIRIVDLRGKNTGLTLVITEDGTEMYYKDGKLHRAGDKPAVIYLNGTQYFYKDGKLHREGDKPAIIYADGSRSFYKDGVLHRDGDKPAMISVSGTQYFYKNGNHVCARD